MHGQSKSNVLLTELIIVILVFSLIAVIVVRMLVGAHKMSSHSARIERARIAAQDWAERLTDKRNPVAVLLAGGFALQDRDANDDAVLTRADANAAGLTDLIIEARLEPEVRSKAGRLLAATVSVFEADSDQSEPLVALPVVSYIPIEPEEI